MMVASLAAQVGGAIYAGNAAKQQADYDASVSDVNADSEKIKARVLKRQNAEASADFRKDFSYFSKTQGVKRRKSGVVAESGSPWLTAMESGREAARELQQMAWNAEHGIDATNRRAAMFGANAGILRIGGGTARTTANIYAGRSLLAGGYKLAQHKGW